MAHFEKDSNHVNTTRTTRIIATEPAEKYTVYVIDVSVDHYSWTVRHRYSDFHDVHEKLVSSYKLDKALLPPKKVFGNQSEQFIKKRQAELETYLHTALYYLADRLPQELATFLDFPKYRTVSIFVPHQNCRQEGLTETGAQLQIFCNESGDVKKDIGHILDFITRLKHLQIIGTNEMVENSNIDMNQLKFDLSLFKSLKLLELTNCNPAMVHGLDTLKQTLERLNVHHTVKAVKDLLLQERSHWRGDNGMMLVDIWPHVTHIDLSHNNITAIDDSIQLLPRVESLDLSYNAIETVENLQWLSDMAQLDISHNAMRHLDALHTKLGNLKSLNVSSNKLESLHGFSKLFSLETLNVSNNQIAQLSEIKCVCHLPCLEVLLLIGNPVTIVSDYRTKVLEMFGDRATEVKLDKHVSSQKELDTVAVLQAIQKSKDIRERQKSPPKKPSPVSDVAIDPSLLESPPLPLPPVVLTEHEEATTTGNHTDNSSCSTEPASIFEANGSNIQNAYSIKSAQLDVEEPLYTIQSQISSSSSQQYSKTAQNLPCNASIYSGLPSETDSGRYSGSGYGDSTCNYYAYDRQNNTLCKTSLADRGLSDVNFSEAVYSKSGLPGADTVSVFGESVGQHLSDSSKNNLRKKGKILSLTDTEIKHVIQPENTDPGCIFIPPEELPDLRDHAFRKCLVDKLLTLNISPSDQSDYSSLIKNCFWCNAVQYSRPTNWVPVCVTLTHRHIFIQRVTKITPGDWRLLELETFYIMPAFNIQQVIIGYQWNYIRLEESFVGMSGTFLLMAPKSDDFVSFVSCLRTLLVEVPRQLSSKPETVDDESCIINMSEKAIEAVKIAISCVENYKELDECQILYLCLGYVDFSPSCLVMTQSSIYLFRDNCMCYPPPTYHLAAKFPSQFELIQRHKLMDKVSDLQLYRVSQVPFEGPVMARPLHEIEIRFEEHGISMLFHDDVEPKPKILNISMLCEEIRNRFLEVFTKLRSDHVNRMSPTRRGEPEGGNEKVEVTIKITAPKEDESDLSSDVGRDDVQVLYTEHEQDDKSNRSSPNKNHISPLTRPRPRTFMALDLAYPSTSLLQKVSSTLHNYTLLTPLSKPMQGLTTMTGEEFLDYFHTTLAQIGLEKEEVCEVIWCNVIPYKNSRQEIITCAILSTQAVYLLSDDSVQEKRSRRPTWKTHIRNKSDSVTERHFKTLNTVHAFGINLHDNSTGAAKRKIIKPYKVLPLKDIKVINVGLFDQCLQLTGIDEDNVLTLLTRDCIQTEVFLKRIKYVFSLLSASPTPEFSLDSSSSEVDFYRVFAQRTKSTVEEIEYSLRGRFRICYPGQEAISDLVFMISNSIPFPTKSDSAGYHIWIYILGFCFLGPYVEDLVDMAQPRSIVLANKLLCLLIEDLVSYPLPDFARGLPENARYELTEIRKVEYLKRVAVYGENIVTLVFSDESDEIDVDTRLEHFGQESMNRGRESPPEVLWTLLIQNSKEKDKFLQLLNTQWSSIHHGMELLVHTM